MKPEAVKECIREIRAASYGKEVREPIATILEEINRKIDAEMEDWEITTEVMDARGHSSTIGSRIDTQKAAFDVNDLYVKLDDVISLLEERQKVKEEGNV